MSASVRSLSYADGSRQEQAVRSLDEAAGFEHFYAEHAPRVRQVARRHLWGPVVEDVVQETFAQAFRSGLHLERDDRDVRVGDLLVGIARNRSIDVLRKRMRGLEEIADDGRVSAMASPAADTDPEHWLLASRRREGITEALQGLCERQRRVMVMRYVEGQGYEAIAAAEGITVAAVKAALNRGRHAFRDLYAAIAEREGLNVWVLGGALLRRAYGRLRQLRDRAGTFGSGPAGTLAAASPAITQAIVTAVVVGTVAVVGAAATAGSAPEPVAHTSEAPPAEEHGRSNENDNGNPRGEHGAPEGEGSSENGRSENGPPEETPPSSGDDEPGPPPRSASAGHSQSVDSEEVSPVEDPPAKANARAGGNAGVDEEGNAKTEQDGEAESESKISKSQTAAANELGTVGKGITTGLDGSNDLDAGCNVDSDGPVMGPVCATDAPTV